MLDHSSFRLMAKAALLIAAGGTLYFLGYGRWMDAAALGTVVLVGSLATAARERLPSLFLFLLLVAALINGLGYALSLWHEETSFDEVVHAFTSFAGCAALVWLLIHRSRIVAPRQSGRVILVAAILGLALGLLWEAFEWAIGIIGGQSDTIMDVAMDLIGAVAAGLLCAWAASKRLTQPCT